MPEPKFKIHCGDELVAPEQIERYACNTQENTLTVRLRDGRVFDGVWTTPDSILLEADPEQFTPSLHRKQAQETSA